MGWWRKVGRSYRRGGLRGLWRDVRATLEVRPTSFPLDPVFKARIQASLDRASAPTKHETSFPTVEELGECWPAHLEQVRRLERANPGDPYYDAAQIEEMRRAGRRVQKGLFEIWLFQRTPSSVILEIGTRTGLSLVNKLGQMPPDRRATAFCLDLFVEQGSPSVVRDNLRRLSIDDGDVHFLVGDSKELVPALLREFPELRFDHALVDGSHDRDDAYADLCNVIPYVRSGGYLVFDDAGPTTEGVIGHDLIDVWERAMNGHAGEFEMHHYDVPDGFCVARRR
jgi:predicted O-methyltransferase YrrM